MLRHQSTYIQMRSAVGKYKQNEKKYSTVLKQKGKLSVAFTIAVLGVKDAIWVYLLCLDSTVAVEIAFK